MRAAISSIGALVLGACAAAVPHATPAPPHDAGPPMDGNLHYIWEGPDAAHERDAGPDPGQGHDTGIDATRPRVDAGAECVPIVGVGELATCPAGSIVRSVGVGAVACCPCTASDCVVAVCCDTDVCAGADTCRGLNCFPLPASCGGMVNTDCDDFPEDCDEPCCPCTSC